MRKHSRALNICLNAEPGAPDGASRSLDFEESEMSTEAHDFGAVRQPADPINRARGDGQDGMPSGSEDVSIAPAEAPSEAFARLEQTAQANGGEYSLPREYEGSFGRTLFDTPASEDGSLTVVMPPAEIEHVTTQALVRIQSYPDNRVYVGAVSAGPFYDPD